MKIEDFLTVDGPLLDVRSPSEFNHGHIPGALSFPLFTDFERAQVGTHYKKEGKEAATKLGLKYVGPKLLTFIEAAEKLANRQQIIRLYCARGGMRSRSMAWLLETAGFQCEILSQGYKSFRNWTLDQFKREYALIVIGGLTGSGKTDLLQELAANNEQVIDLEKIAQHRGSSFGHLEYGNQPSSEHFENILAWELSRFKADRSIWIEDESRSIGTCHLPHEFFMRMDHAPFIWIDRSREDRIQHLLTTYGNYPQEKTIEATERLEKKLGAVRTKEVIEWIKNQDLEKAISILLEYYDQSYTYSCKRRNRSPFFKLGCLDTDPIEKLKRLSPSIDAHSLLQI